MTWLEMFGWAFAIAIALHLFYHSGVKAGIKHALMTLNLDQFQIEKLNKELKKDDVAMEAMKEDIENSNKSLLN